MTATDTFLTRVAKLAQELGVPFVIAVRDEAAGKAKFMASFGAVDMLKPFLLKQLGVTEPSEEIQEVSWEDR